MIGASGAEAAACRATSPERCPEKIPGEVPDGIIDGIGVEQRCPGASGARRSLTAGQGQAGRLSSLPCRISADQRSGAGGLSEVSDVLRPSSRRAARHTLADLRAEHLARPT